MYMKLGNTRINYTTNPIDDFLIFGGIVDSEIGPGKPKLIRTVQELECHFGKDFDEYNFYCELLSYSNVSLYLASTSERNRTFETIEIDGESYDKRSDIYQATNFAGFKFINKSVGSVEEGIYVVDSKIGVRIEVLGNNVFRFTITRFGYEEVFEGSVDNIPGKNRIDYMISQKSNLISCELIDKTQLPEEDVSKDLFIDGNGLYLISISEDGEETRVFGISDKIITSSYAALLEEMFSEDEDNIYVDYLLLPRLGNIVINKLIKIASDFNFQALIDVPGDYTTTEDGDNRLIYFYSSGNLLYNGWARPGYYTFLRGIINGIFSWSGNDISYVPPENTETLEDNHINFLTSNNYKYFFRKYFNMGTGTTIWKRFAIGKIYRELMKNKWNYLGKKDTDAFTEDNIRTILDRIVSYFPIISSIDIEELNIDSRNNKLSLTLRTEVDDLADNDIELDITINY